MGSITEDRNAAISGFTGRAAVLVPIDVRVGANTYRMRMVQDKVMTPLLAQMAVFNSLDATERAMGPSAFTVRGRLDFDGGSVRLDNVYSGDVAATAAASLGVATPLSFALGSGFDALKLKGASIEISTADRKNQLQIVSLTAPRQVHPGDDIELAVTLAGENVAETLKTVHYRVPIGAPLGTLNFTAADATATNLLELLPAVS